MLCRCRTLQATIRLALINTPERSQKGYSKATDFTSSICPIGDKTLVDEDDGQTEGSYDRMVAKVYCCGKMLMKNYCALTMQKSIRSSAMSANLEKKTGLQNMGVSAALQALFC